MSLGVPDKPIWLDPSILPTPTGWRRYANCRYAPDGDEFFPASISDERQAVAYWCQPCGVRLECLTAEIEATGLSPPLQLGVRALTASDRRRLIAHLQANDLAVWDIDDEMITEHDSSPKEATDA